MNTQRVLITAGAAGIGRAIAEAFAAHGARVFVCDIDRHGLDELQRAYPAIGTMVCDVSKADEIRQMVDRAVQALGGLDVLVNNAGIAGPTAPTEALDPADWSKVLQVNLSGTFEVSRLAIPHLKQSPAGSIINMSSAAGRFGYPNRIAYSTTKWGLVGFTKTLAMELGQYGIRVNAIQPGAVDGPRFQNVIANRAKISGRSIEEESRSALAAQSLKYQVNPKHIADLAVFLASDSGRSISGQTLPIDGDMQHSG